MSLRSHEHRAQAWSNLLEAGDDQRELWFDLITESLHKDIGPILDLYDEGYSELFLSTLRELHSAELLPALEEAFTAVESGDETHAEEFVASVIAALADAAEHSDAASSLRSTWRHHMYNRLANDGETLSVAEVAGIYQVTPQAVYKWIREDKIESTSTPGGGKLRIPKSALRTSREDESAIDALQEKLAKRSRELGADKLSDEEIVRRIRELRNSK
jgi:excisionase family DNA binding protein